METMESQQVHPEELHQLIEVLPKEEEQIVRVNKYFILSRH